MTRIDTLTKRFNDHESEHITDNLLERVIALEKALKAIKDGEMGFYPRLKFEKYLKKIIKQNGKQKIPTRRDNRS